VQDYLEGSLAQFNEQAGVGDYFWNISLEDEPRERGIGVGGSTLPRAWMDLDK